MRRWRPAAALFDGMGLLVLLVWLAAPVLAMVVLAAATRVELELEVVLG